MDDSARFAFRISAYTPDTIPMDRLARYMQEIAALMGNENHVHFDGLRKGSTVLRAKVEHEGIPKVENRLNVVGRAGAPADVVRTVSKLNKLLAEDNARATLKRIGCTAEIIKFPGRDIAAPQNIGPIKETGVLEGTIVKIGGKDQTVPVLLVGESGQEYRLTTTSREVAKQMASHLFETVRVNGIGTWYRRESGLWELENFQVQGFDTVDERTLIEAIAGLRAIEGADWQTMEDPLDTWQELRKD